MTNEELVELIKNNIDRQKNLLMLWDANKGVIHMAISKYAKSVPYEDLEQSAFLAMNDAVNSYDSSKGSFTTYLSFWLKRYCVEETAKLYPLSADINTLTAVAKYHRIQTEFEKRFGSLPSDQELRSLMKMDSATFNRIKQASERMNTLSLDAKNMNLDDENMSIGDSVPDRSVDIETEILDKVSAEELHNELEETLTSLPYDQEQVLRMRYYQNKDTKTVAVDMGITEAEVYRYKDKAFRQIRHNRKRYKRLQRYYEEKFLTGIYRGGFRKFVENGSQTEKLAIDMFMKELNLLQIQTERESQVLMR